MYREKGNLSCVTWRDRKPVSVLGTLPTSTMDSNPVQQSVKVNRKWEKKQFSRPGVTDLYNTYKGGVDVCDQQTIAHVRLMKRSVWYYEVFFDMIDCWFMNEQSFVLVRHITRGCIAHEETFASFAYFIDFSIFTSQKAIIIQC